MGYYQVLVESSNGTGIVYGNYADLLSASNGMNCAFCLGYRKALILPVGGAVIAPDDTNKEIIMMCGAAGHCDSCRTAAHCAVITFGSLPLCQKCPKYLTLSKVS